MNKKLHEMAREIFLDCLELEDSQINDYVNSKTNNQEVIKLVIGLVKSHKSNNLKTEKFNQAISNSLTQNASIFPTDRYKLLEKIGQGGMGDVYLAQRNVKNINQKVAVKILSGSDDISKERFSQETSILSQLSHPNISQFIDADFLKDQTPYVVMEYASGIPLDEYCNKYELSLNKKLSLFLELCEAVQYAHRNLVIHRDLKPSNILVSENGELKLIDFGIAKIQQDVQHKTVTHLRAMTPAYASPEQFLGKIVSVSSDVYSLGVILYELLVGDRPFNFNNKTPIEIERELTTQTPIKPSQKLIEDHNIQLKYIDKDLDKITLKALRFDTKLRYQTVAELNDDIHRYLNNLPVLAQKPSFSYKAIKFFKRNKLFVASSIVAITIVTGFIYIVINQRNLAVREKLRAQTLADTFIQAFNNADPTNANSTEVKAIDIMRQSEELIRANTKNNPILTSQLLLPISSIYRKLEESQKAQELLSLIEPHYGALSIKDRIIFKSEKAIVNLKFVSEKETFLFIDSAIEELGKDPLLIYTYGFVSRFYANNKKAIPILSEYLSGLSKQHELYIPICSIYAYLVFSDDQFNKAKLIHEKCLEAINNKSQNPYILWQKSQLNFQLGRIALETKKYTRAQELFDQVKNVRTKLLGEQHRLTTDISIYLADVLIRSGYPEKAFGLIEIGIKGRKLTTSDPVTQNSIISGPLYFKANAYFALKDYESAEALYRLIIKYRLDANIEHLYNTASYYRGLGHSLYHLNKFEQSVNAYNRAIEIYEDQKYNDMVHAAETRVLLAQTYYKLQNFSQSQQLINESKEIIGTNEIVEEGIRKLANEIQSKITSP